MLKPKNIELYDDVELKGIEYGTCSYDWKDTPCVDIYTEAYDTEYGYMNSCVTIPFIPNAEYVGWGVLYFINAGIVNFHDILELLSNESGTTYRLYSRADDYVECVPSRGWDEKVS